MPTRVNGIGTAYAGKRNAEKFVGVCESCRREIELSNYETTLWFTIVFIPVIPLGKKQIFNYCPICTRHGAMPLAKWEAIKRETLTEKLAAWNRNNDDAAAAIQLLETFAAFRQFDEGRQLADVMAARFPQSATVQVALGQWWANVDQNENSERCFRKAYELDSTNIQARHALIIFSLSRDDAVAADQLMQKSPSISADDDPNLHYMLSAAYHRQGRNAEALQTLRGVLQASPKFASNKEVRKLVRETERALGEHESILPHRPIYSFPGFWIAAAVLVALGGALGWNWMVASNRTVHIVNGFQKPVSVAVDGGPSVTVAPQGRSELKVAEGQHQAVVQRDGAQPETIEFRVSSGFFDRYVKSPVFVLNPGGAAPLSWEKTTYTVAGGGANSYQLHINQPFTTYPDIDFIFTSFPPTMQLKNGIPISKTRIDLISADPESLIGFEDTVADDEKMKYAEIHLDDNFGNRDLLAQYLNLAQKTNQIERAKNFLETYLDRRPVAVEFHRVYQHFRSSGEGSGDLIKEYRQRLAAEPNNAVLMYLVGRLEPRREDAVRLYDQAIAADPKLFYPKYAKAHILLALGDFVAARKLAEEALAIDPEMPEAQDLWFKVRLANREYRALESEFRTKVQSERLGLNSHLRLMYVLAAQRKLRELDQINDRFQQMVAAEQISPAVQDLLTKPVRQAAMYLQQRMERLLTDAGEASVENAAIRFAALLELGRLDRAGEALHNVPPQSDNGYWALCLAIAWRQQGKDALADLWQSTACDWLAGDVKNQLAAKIIRQPGNVDLAELAQFAPQPNEMAVVLTAVAHRCGNQKQQILELARKLNFQLEFPHNFLKGAIEAEQGRK